MLKINITAGPLDLILLGEALEKIKAQLLTQGIIAKQLIEEAVDEIKHEFGKDFQIQIIEYRHGVPDTDPEFESIAQRLAEQDAKT